MNRRNRHADQLIEGGGIVVVAPYRAAVAVWSPCLNESGNSYGGTIALEHIARETGWSIF